MAMADLAKHSVGQDAVPLSAIAERQGISLAYLEQIFIRLRRSGLVESARGRSGGYRLGQESGRITIAEVMRAVDEDVRMTRCTGEQPTACVGGQRCLTHGLWDALGERINSFLSGVTLDDVINGSLAQPRPRQAPALFDGGMTR
jgi:Rrf2 family protein